MSGMLPADLLRRSRGGDRVGRRGAMPRRVAPQADRWLAIGTLATGTLAIGTLAWVGSGLLVALAWSAAASVAQEGPASAGPQATLLRADGADPLATALSALQEADRIDGDQRPLRAAWQAATAADVGSLPALLAAMQDAGPLAENWLRMAVDTVAERSLASSGSLPESLLEGVVLDRDYAPRARRTAYEWIVRVDAAATERLLPKMLDDTSLEMRFDAVEHLIAQAAAATDRETRCGLYREALEASRDVAQVQAVAEALSKEEVEVDLARQLGFVMQWRLIGPFDNTGLKGFSQPFPPEKERDFAASYAGKAGPVAWQEFRSDDRLGVVDLNKALGEDKEVTAYAVASIEAEKALEGELRLASKNAPQVWFNGELQGAFEVYHAGGDIDQYVLPVTIRQGTNEIVVKASQNEKKMSWEGDWQFQLRVTDPLGGAAPVLQSDLQSEASVR